jgi:hypothetical protein
MLAQSEGQERHMECIVIDGGRRRLGQACRMRREREPRGQPHFVLPPNLYNGTPGRGDFLVSNFHPGAIPGNLVRKDFWRRGGPGGPSLVFGYLLGAILFHGVLGREFGYRTGVLILTREPDRLLPF